MADYVDEALGDVEGGYVEEEDDDMEEMVEGLVEVGAISEVGARRILKGKGRVRKMNLLTKALQKGLGEYTGPGKGLPSPPFGQSSRSTERRAPLGFVEDESGASFFTIAAGATTIMRAKVSRVAHVNRLLIVPSAPGVVLQSVKVGDEEQMLAPGAPVELYSTDALTDSVPDNFSPLGGALDFSVTLLNTTGAPITGTIGIKADVKR